MSRFDFSHPPFDTLTTAERQTLEQAADLEYFADDAQIFGPGDPIEAFYVVLKGVVCERAGDELVAIYREHDTFDARALTAGSSEQRFVVHEEALLFVLPRAVIFALTARNPRFGAFFYTSVAQKFGALAQNTGKRELQTLLTATVADACNKQPVFLDASASVLDAAQAMKREKAKSILVRRGTETGIFTTSDFRDVIINQTASDTPLSEVCHFKLITCDSQDYLFNALLTMTQQNIQRVVVLEQGQPSGILEQVDLLSYFSNHSHLIAQRLEQAHSIEQLEPIAEQITRLIQILSGHGVKAPQLGRLVQALNTRLFERAWQMIAPAEIVENSCLFVMGSEGRGEQILKTDQDNALIVRDGFDSPELTPACARFSQALASFGYPPCPGNIMLSNPLWCQPEAATRARIYRWLYSPDADSALQLAIFSDAHRVAGDASLLAGCRDYLGSLIRDDARFFSRFAKAIEQFDTPLGLFAHLLTREHAGKPSLDLKKGGIFPIVHGIRALALEQGLLENNSFERLSRLSTLGALDKAMAGDLSETLSFLLNLKLTQGLAALERGDTPNNLIVPDSLSSLERDMLKDALQVVKKFKVLLQHHFHLGSF